MIDILSYASEIVKHSYNIQTNAPRPHLFRQQVMRSIAMIVPATADSVTVRVIFRFNCYLRRPGLAFFAFLTAGFLFFRAPPWRDRA
jgi:hypothetical protein